MAGLSEQEIIRREKLAKLRALGIDPYPAPLFPVDHSSEDIKNNFEEGKKVVIAGRLMSRRIQGKASFAELQDSKGRIQVYFNRDEICTGEDKTLYNEVYKKTPRYWRYHWIGRNAFHHPSRRENGTSDFVFCLK